MRYVVPVEDLKSGMFVAELDRPWIETPFLIQGFVIDGESEIKELRRLCRKVTVDPSRSVCLNVDFFRYAKANAMRRLPEASKERAVEQDDFYAAAYLIGTGQVLPPRASIPEIIAREGQSSLVADVLYSATIVVDVQETLHTVFETIGQSKQPDVMQLASLTSEMAQSVMRNRDAMIWLTKLKCINDYSYDHALDVSVHMMVFGAFLGLPVSTIETLGLAGMLQDVGKCALPPELLNKREQLNDDERREIRAHVASSLDLLRKTEVFSPSLFDIVAHHHERHDGSGYPLGIKGRDLSLNAEIGGLIDTYCAMLRTRPYSDGLSNQRVLEELYRLRTSTFRDTLVEQLIQCIGLYPIGTLVDLSTGEVGVVIEQNQVRRLQPKVLVVLGPDKSVEAYPRTLDLLMQPKGPDGEPISVLRALPGNAYGIDPTDFYLGH
jgi:HD-GYP domain-containing protein (c-di-GMP phosphodiesterase class II)